MIRRPPRSTQGVSSAASDVYKRQTQAPYPLGPPSMPHQSTIPSSATLVSPQVTSPSRVSPCPLQPRVAFRDAPRPTNVNPPSSVIRPVPLATSPSATMPSRRSRTSQSAPRLPSTTAPAKRASLPSSHDSSSTLRSLGRIIPAHSHSDYNRRDFTRSAVPGSVYSLKVTF